MYDKGAAGAGQTYGPGLAAGILGEPICRYASLLRACSHSLWMPKTSVTLPVGLRESLCEIAACHSSLNMALPAEPDLWAVCGQAPDYQADYDAEKTKDLKWRIVCAGVQRLIEQQGLDEADVMLWFDWQSSALR